MSVAVVFYLPCFWEPKFVNFFWGAKESSAARFLGPDFWAPWKLKNSGSGTQLAGCHSGELFNLWAIYDVYKNMNKYVGVNIHMYTNPTNPTIEINLFRSNFRGRIVQFVHFVLEWEAPRGPVISVAWETGSFGWWRREGLLGPTPPLHADWKRVSKLECYGFLAHLQAAHTYCITSKEYMHHRVIFTIPIIQYDMQIFGFSKSSSVVGNLFL